MSVYLFLGTLDIPETVCYNITCKREMFMNYE